MKTLEELGFRFHWEDFCPGIEKGEYINDEKIIVFWRAGDISCYSADGMKKMNFTNEEMIACGLKLKEKGW